MTLGVPCRLFALWFPVEAACVCVRMLGALCVCVVSAVLLCGRNGTPAILSGMVVFEKTRFPPLGICYPVS